ncbi:MAG: YncE family protein [Rhodospirillales bacterium]
MTGWLVDCEENRLISEVSIGINNPIWDHVGLDFNEAGDRLYVTNPEENELVVFDTSTFTELPPPISVGDHPFDVKAITIKTNLGTFEERLYVVNHGDAAVANSDTMSIVDPTTGLVLVERPLNSDFNDSNHLGMTRIVGSLEVETLSPLVVRGENLYLTSPGRHEVFRYFVQNDGDLPTPLEQQGIQVFSTPGQVTVEHPETP